MKLSELSPHIYTTQAWTLQSVWRWAIQTSLPLGLPGWTTCTCFWCTLVEIVYLLEVILFWQRAPLHDPNISFATLPVAARQFPHTLFNSDETPVTKPHFSNLRRALAKVCISKLMAKSRNVKTESQLALRLYHVGRTIAIDTTLLDIVSTYLSHWLDALPTARWTWLTNLSGLLPQAKVFKYLTKDLLPTQHRVFSVGFHTCN